MNNWRSQSLNATDVVRDLAKRLFLSEDTLKDCKTKKIMKKLNSFVAYFWFSPCLSISQLFALKQAFELIS
jgi:hypothetical protein